MASLEDLKLPSSNENNAGKATALDHLGLIAGRLRSNALKWNKRNKAGIESKYVLLPIEEVSIMPLFFAEISSQCLKVGSDTRRIWIGLYGQRSSRTKNTSFEVFK